MYCNCSRDVFCRLVESSSEFRIILTDGRCDGKITWDWAGLDSDICPLGLSLGDSAPGAAILGESKAYEGDDGEDGRLHVYSSLCYVDCSGYGNVFGSSGSNDCIDRFKRMAAALGLRK